jgi:hypothetical protein
MKGALNFRIRYAEHDFLTLDAPRSAHGHARNLLYKHAGSGMDTSIKV